MKSAQAPSRHRREAKLLHVDHTGDIQPHRRANLVKLLRRSDVVVANDAATLPASLHGTHVRTGASVEVRLAAWASPLGSLTARFVAVIFGAGDYRDRTEDRSMPPTLQIGDELDVAGLTARVIRLLDHPRLIELEFAADTTALWPALATHGNPIQYSYVRERLQVWDTWTSFAATPLAFEAPSAGFALSWRTIAELRQRGITFVTLTHAAGISSTGDPSLDRRLPFDEAYRIPAQTAALVSAARRSGRRVIAVGTSVVRALEDAARQHGSVVAGSGVARLRIGAATRLHVVDVVLSGTHEVGESHFELLRAFASDDVLDRAGRQLEADEYLNHEFGDSVLIEAGKRVNGGWEVVEANAADLTQHAG